MSDSTISLLIAIAVWALVAAVGAVTVWLAVVAYRDDDERRK